MRMPRYLSPTSLKLFYSDRNAYYTQYLCDTRTPKLPQTEPMAVGSSFDAYVKSFLVERLIGKLPEFEFRTIFEAQVEPQNRDAALRDGKIVFDAYTKQGALADILLDLEGCVGKPRFETAIEGYVAGVSGTLGDVPMLGKPDIFFITKQGVRVIFDWKVNGFYSNYNTSPKPGYVRMRSNNPKTNGQMHSKAMLLNEKDVRICITHPLDTVDSEWAAQLAIYAWLLGEPVGSRFVVAIDQIACGKDAIGQRMFNIAQHRSVVNEKFQHELFEKAHKAWYLIQSGHIFDEMTREDSDKQCQLLDLMAQTPPDPDFEAVLR